MEHVDRNLEVPRGALHLPGHNGVFILRDLVGATYRLRAPTRRSGRRSLAEDWKAFSAAKNLKAGQQLRMYRVGNEYSVEVDVKLFGMSVSWRPL
ncbi:unnamed protein product [Ilex paraguariensis]|uniref:TF-B3 domain-containing protein n=1 Tax=Ilex paraguariensis TaxID=185542 RepID=A0ABC8QT64_9AQUA